MKTFVSLLALLTLASIVSAQESKLIAVSLPPPILIPHPPPPPVCFADAKLSLDTAADTDEAEGDVAEADLKLAWLPPQRRCEDGPVRKLLGGSNVFYWPPIYRGSCDNLFCRDPPCIARVKRIRFRCVLVYKFIRGCWRKVGFRTVRYEDHLRCGCKQCSDMKDERWCVQTKPCPNGKTPDSFCYWRRTPWFQTAAASAADSLVAIPVPVRFQCACCTPTPCPRPKIFSSKTCSCVCPAIRCPPGRVFNPVTCQCDCPKGSKLINGKCVGDCSDISLGSCSHVACSDNQHFNCQLKDHKCVCPSCERATDPLWCRKTVCLEQHTHPMCVYDDYKCRCPTCEDQKDEKWCLKTLCGPNNHLTCRFEKYWNKCFCPH